MSAANPSVASQIVVLGPEHKAAEVQQLLTQGRTDVDAVRSWAMSFVIDMTNAAEATALVGMVPLADFIAINSKQIELATNRRAVVDKSGLRVTFAKTGRAVLNGLKLNQSAEGKGGAPLSLFPAQVSTLIDALPMFLSAVLDNAETLIPAGELDTVLNPEYEKQRAAGKTDAELKALKVPKLVKLPHVRAGLPAMDWSGCDKTATVAKIRSALEAVRTMKPVAELK